MTARASCAREPGPTRAAGPCRLASPFQRKCRPSFNPARRHSCRIYSPGRWRPTRQADFQRLGYPDLYLLNRYYDPATAQFLTIDPLVSGTHSAYGYVGNNPTNFADPAGLTREVDVTGLPGYIRAQQHGDSWASGDLQEAISDWVGAPGDPAVNIDPGSGAGKIVYSNSATGFRVVYDAGGNYFRVQSPTGAYLTDAGEWDSQRNLSSSHFLNTGTQVSCVENAREQWAAEQRDEEQSAAEANAAEASALAEEEQAALAQAEAQAQAEMMMIEAEADE